MAEKVKRKHPADTGDSEAVPCPRCQGTAKDPIYGSPCQTCAGAGFITQQRFNATTGLPVRVVLEG